MSRLTRQMVESPNNQELMRESSPEDGKVDAAHECSSLTEECDGRVIDHTNPVPVIEVLAFYDLTPSEHTKRIAASYESEAKKKCSGKCRPDAPERQACLWAGGVK